MGKRNPENAEVYTIPGGVREEVGALLSRLEAWERSARARTVREALARAGVQTAWLVGGTVRDLALGRPDPPDLDLAFPGEAARAAFEVARLGEGTAFPLDEGRGVWRVALPGGVTVDLAPLRAPTLAEDLAGRDFTVNAVAWTLGEDRGLVDPLGGLRDLAERRLRPCRADALEEDPVRVLRAYRLAVGLGLEIDPGLEQSLARAAPGLGRVAPERIRTELFACLGLVGGSRGLRLMAAHGVLEVLFPFVGDWRGFDQGDYHAYDLWEHALRTAEEAERLAEGEEWMPRPDRLREHLAEELEAGITRRALLVFAACLHDLAKPECASQDGNRRRFTGHETRGGHLLRGILAGLRVGRRARGAAQRAVAAHLRLFQLSRQHPPTERARLRYLRDLRAETPEAVLLSVADERATGPAPPAREAVERTAAEVLDLYWRKRDHREIPPLLRGRDLVELGVPPGPEVGRLLRAVAEAEARGEVATRNEALALVRKEREKEHTPP
ncbi:HD domain-containing protein [Deferrisoma camini]|uniref:HD domain-containing protein n=1 Tax=Deferrisoma camini TaxID=1035120 RepID=UPI00046CF2ED|nr:HD domain-containing protein [Deferrisoma camini]